MKSLPKSSGSGQIRSFIVEWGDHTRTWMALKTSSKRTKSSIPAYWLPQGGYIDIPSKKPSAQYVFTSELTGCYIKVDKEGDNLRIFHIQNPLDIVSMEKQYTDNRKGELIAQIIFPDYGVEGNPNRVKATSLLHYTTPWLLWGQVIEGPTIGIANGKPISNNGPNFTQTVVEVIERKCN